MATRKSFLKTTIWFESMPRIWTISKPSWAAASTKKSTKITWYHDSAPFLDSASWETCTEFWICCRVILVEQHIKNSVHVYSHRDELLLTTTTTTTTEHSNQRCCSVVRSGTGCTVCDEILFCESWVDFFHSWVPMFRFSTTATARYSEVQRSAFLMTVGANHA